MKDDLISRQAAIEALGEMPEVWEEDDDEGRGEQNQWYMDKIAIEALPTADLSEYCDKLWKTAYERGKEAARPQKGKWKVWYHGFGDGQSNFSYTCSECGHHGDNTDYCPHCGARMEE